MHQNCAEMMLIKAGQLIGKTVQFDYKNPVEDIQVDISEAFMLSSDEEKRIWFNGHDQQLLEHDLATLDKQKAYFLRTGTNGGAGHWQTLYFDKLQQGWIRYSTQTNQHQITHNGLLTELGKNLLMPFARWGACNGQYSFLLVDATEQNIMNAASYLYNVRVLGACAALEKLYEHTTLTIKKYGENSSTEKQEELNKILIDLSQKIGDLDQHHFKKAQLVAQELLRQLENAKSEYLTTLQNMDSNIEDADTIFKTKCKTLIDAARPILARDLDWETYLTNLFKSIANVVLNTISCGHINSFFKPAVAESLQIIESAATALLVPDIELNRFALTRSRRLLR